MNYKLGRIYELDIQPTLHVITLDQDSLLYERVTLEIVQSSSEM